ncbi:MAG TPA: SpoIVB peptidase S55 domain-containing protein [Candidatus Ozemobacteraceae bacterium]|nr:SpoIVB peptidase S55 domain-containing protein [Candidatus Ozemobacteraceae bacterium]HQG27770.1 SpoIVB peptidase S55 domain-containing protein [Candidatus Ozemobacteraceae bacterium]
MAYSLRHADARSLLSCRLLVLLAVFAVIGSQGIAAEEMLLLRDLKVGMKGIGKTVIHGREIETFNVEVMGILANNKINENVLISGKSILVRVAGKVIDDAGGIAAGMSGSPIYINNKLVGGLSSGWVMTDHTVGLVTPIEEMLEIWDYPLMTSRSADPDAPVRWSCSEPIRLGGREIRSIIECDDPESLGRDVAQDEAVFMRAAAPVVIQGLCEKAVGVLNGRNRKFKMVPVPAGVGPLPSLPAIPSQASGASGISDPLEPGSAIGVQLARGDINLTTLGTLTYRDGKRILGFAHPFMKKGNVSFLMTGAHIYHCFSSVEMPFKIGAPTDVLGIITQDREKGIAGEVGRFPAMIPIQIDVTDKDLKRTRSINFQIVRDPEVLTSVLESTLVQSIEGVIDRGGEGTALMGIALECTGSSGQKYNLRRENLFYSRDDIVGSLIEEVTGLFDTLTGNELEEVWPTRLMLKIEVEKRRRTMTVEKVEVKNTSITPGGMLEVWVSMRPYREKSVVRKVRLPIPLEIGKENLTLTVYGLTMNRTDEGVSSDAPSKDSGKTGREKVRLEEAAHDTFESSIRSWVSAPRNSDLVFQLAVEGDESKKVKIDGRDFLTESTNLVVLGRVDSTITLSED